MNGDLLKADYKILHAPNRRPFNDEPRPLRIAVGGNLAFKQIARVMT
jgi:hypothetical protein